MTLTTLRMGFAGAALAAGALSCEAQPPAAPAPAVVPAAATQAGKPTGAPEFLSFEDQFGRKADLAALRGRVVVLVYGDRGGTDACREYGEQMHVLFHPTAKGQPPEAARVAPVAPLDGVPTGKPSPDVAVVPVACAGKVPGVVRDFIQAQVKKNCPNVVVWMDFAGTMAEKYGLKSGEVNMAVFDTAGRLRLKVNGTPDQTAGLKVVQAVQDLRAEAAGLR